MMKKCIVKLNGYDNEILNAVDAIFEGLKKNEKTSFVDIELANLIAILGGTRLEKASAKQLHKLHSVMSQMIKMMNDILEEE